LLKPILRLPPRSTLLSIDDDEAVERLKGDVVVWWYERQRKNIDAETIPYVDVIFRFLDRYDVPAGYTTASIGISRLSSFRIGTIWRNGRCVAETDFGPEHEFSVDFTAEAWSLTSFSQSLENNLGLPISSNDYAFRYDKTDAHLLDFPLANGKNLLVPCVEFLARCYGSTSEMARILSTYDWKTVQEKLYKTVEKSPDKWKVSPREHVPDADGLILASMLYDPYAERAAKIIYSQFDSALGKGQNHVSLKVEPWFQGPARLACRGLWINNGATFLCLEVMGMSQPQDNPYEIHRVRYSTEDPDQGAKVVTPVKPPLELPLEQDPFDITDLDEPDSEATRKTIQDLGFRIIGDRCPFIKSTEELLFSERKTVPKLEKLKDKYSTGDADGIESGIGKVVFSAHRFVGDGGIINDTWKELCRLASVPQKISNLAWYNKKDGFVSDENFKLHPLTIEKDETPSLKVRRWLAFPSNATLTRGVLIARLTANDRTFYLFEIQRKKVHRDSAIKEEQISGLLVEIDSPLQALREINYICDKIRYRRGKFSQLLGLRNLPHHIFRHISNDDKFLAETTIRSAFKQLDVHV